MNNNLSNQNIANINRSLEYSEIAKTQSSPNSTGLDIMHKFFSTKSEPTKRIKSMFNLQRLKNLTVIKNSFINKFI